MAEVVAVRRWEQVAEQRVRERAQARAPRVRAPEPARVQVQPERARVRVRESAPARVRAQPEREQAPERAADRETRRSIARTNEARPKMRTKGRASRSVLVTAESATCSRRIPDAEAYRPCEPDHSGLAFATARPWD